MEIINFPRKRKSSDRVGEAIQQVLNARKQTRIEGGPSGECSSRPGQNPVNNGDKEKAFIVRISPYSLDIPSKPRVERNHQKDLNSNSDDEQIVLSEDNGRPPFFLQNMSVDDDDIENPKKYFTLYDIKDDDTSKLALTAKRRLRYTDVQRLIRPEELMFLTTACDYFQADIDDLMDYIDSIGEMRNKQIIVEHCYFMFFMNVLKQFYYTDRGWRFEIVFDDFFVGVLRKHREPLIADMNRNFENAKMAARRAREAQAALMKNELKIDIGNREPAIEGAKMGPHMEVSRPQMNPDIRQQLRLEINNV